MNESIYYNHINELRHYGVEGMKWGVRRYQNEDGSLTAAGKERYLSKEDRKTAKMLERGVNAFEQKRANEIAKGNKLKKQYERVAKKNKNGKYNKQLDSLGWKRIASDAKVKMHEDAIKRATEVAKKQGYTISSKQKKRMTDSGKTTLNYMLNGIFGGLASASAMRGQTKDAKKLVDYMMKVDADFGGYDENGNETKVTTTHVIRL